MTSNRFRQTWVAIVVLCASLGFTGLAQTASPEYIRAISTIYAAGAAGKLINRVVR